MIPGLLPTFLHGCEIKSGSGLGTRLSWWSYTYLYVQKNVLIMFQDVYQTCSLSYGLSIFTLQCSTLGLHDLWPPFREWYHPSAILLSATLSQRVISALYDLSDVDFDLPVEGIDLDELWPSFVLWVDSRLASHTLCREEGSGHAATIKLACCDVIVLNDHGCDLQGAWIWLVSSSFYCGVVTTRWLQRDQTLPLCEGVIPTRSIVYLHV